MSDDAHLADALVRHGARGLEAVYTAYAPKLYTYALTMLHDPATAQDVVHDALLIAAESIDQLRDHKRFRAWLYAITRNECLRTLRGRKRFSGSAEVVDVADSSIDLEAGLRRDEAARLIGQAMAVMSPADRDVLSLALQHDLDAERISEISGTSTNTVHARLSRARAGLSDAVGALALYRSQRRCEELRTLIGDQPLTPLLRKRIQRHVKSCDECEGRRRAALAAIGPAMAAPLYITPPASLGRRVLADWHRGEGQPLAQRAAPFDASGFPVPLDTPGSHRIAVAIVAAASALLMVGLGALLLGGDTTEPSAQGTVVTTTPSTVPAPVPPPTEAAPTVDEPAPTPKKTQTNPTRQEAPAAPAEPPVSATTTPRPATTVPKADTSSKNPKPARSTASPTPTPTATSQQPAPAPPAPGPTEPSTTVEPPAITSVTLVDEDRAADGNFTRCDAFRLTITASATGASAVEALIAPVDSRTALAGDPWRATVTLAPGEYAVAVRATGPGGTVTKDAGSILHICPG